MGGSGSFGRSARPLPPLPRTAMPPSIHHFMAADITDTPVGREIHGLCAWSYGIGRPGDRRWPLIEGGHARGRGRPPYVLGYDRRALILAVGPADEIREGIDWSDPRPAGTRHCLVFGVLEGTPPKASCVVDLHALVGDLTTGDVVQGWCVWFQSGWRRDRYFYDPSRRILWPWGDRTRRTALWRVPGLDEVGGADPADDPASEPPAEPGL